MSAQRCVISFRRPSKNGVESTLILYFSSISSKAFVPKGTLFPMFIFLCWKRFLWDSKYYFFYFLNILGFIHLSLWLLVILSNNTPCSCMLHCVTNSTLLVKHQPEILLLRSLRSFNTHFRKSFTRSTVMMGLVTK